ncbi:hypothetical protein AGR1B_Cc120484 [Agrobacterium fabacearum S56]|nr:hypothetical protein AGR1B_Cc120484 [Agrobacterium fabacearum S56]
MPLLLENMINIRNHIPALPFGTLTLLGNSSGSSHFV